MILAWESGMNMDTERERGGKWDEFVVSVGNETQA